MKNTAMLLLTVCACLSLCEPLGAQSSWLIGQVCWHNNTPAQGVSVTVLGQSVITDQNGSYSLGPLTSGQCVVSISPPGKVARPFNVMVTGNTVQKFRIDW